jgi:hypothetical protein
MPIAFFESRCKTESNNVKFGLCDDPPPLQSPAYINENDATKWIGIVNNPIGKHVDFYGIDNCIDIRKADGNMESRCDGVLHFDNSLSFVELKMREGSGWLSKARSQLTITIEKFKEKYDLTVYNKVDAYACNSLRPAANQGNSTQIQQFKDETGLILYVQQDIII